MTTLGRDSDIIRAIAFIICANTTTEAHNTPEKQLYFSYSKVSNPDDAQLLNAALAHTLASSLIHVIVVVGGACARMGVDEPLPEGRQSDQCVCARHMHYSQQEHARLLYCAFIQESVRPLKQVRARVN